MTELLDYELYPYDETPYDPDNGFGEWDEPEGLFEGPDEGIFDPLTVVTLAAISQVKTLRIGKATFVPSAAHSYARMLRAGMPEAGYVNSFRTYAQQAVLYKAYKAGKGNLAAKPGTSRHEKGYATDISTGSAQQRWLSVGGTYNKVNSGEKIRANDYGWFRTVKNEPWHFEYKPTKDKNNKPNDKTKKLQKAIGVTADGVFGVGTFNALKAWQAKNGLVADGIDGPKTWAKIEGAPVPTPPPAPTPAKKRRAFRMLSINTLAERFQKKGGPGVPDNSDKWPKWIATQTPSVVLLQEVSATRRDAIRKHLGASKWLAYPVGYVSVMWQAAKWEHLSKKEYTPGNGIHGAMRVTLRDKEGSGLEVDVVSVHVRPTASFPGSYSTEQVVQAKLKELRAALGMVLRNGVGTYVGGDFNTSRHKEVMQSLGFRRATPEVATAGTNKLDAVWYRDGKTSLVPVRGATLVDAGKLTDHKGWLVNATIEEK